MGKMIRRTGWQTTTRSGLLTEVRGAWYDLVAMDAGSGDMLSDDSGCGLYVHIPFCRAKCGYCDFFSIAAEGPKTAPFVARVCRELEQRVAESPHRVRTVFYGGGTPTILSADQLATLLRFPAKLLPFGQVEECTVEANPATVDEEKAELLVDSGVTRVSMGAQSFVAEELSRLERLHRVEDIAPSIAILRRHGDLQINLDLMFGIPGQTLETWNESLRRAIDLEPDHIACYGLTYEPGTRLTAQRDRGRVKPCDEGLEADMYMLAADVLAEAGFEQYEISNYAKPGSRCRHNLGYWRNQPYLGVGPSATGCIDNRRYKNVADVAAYVRMIDQQGHAETEVETLDDEMIMTELIMLQLRLVEGLSIPYFGSNRGRH